MFLCSDPAIDVANSLDGLTPPSRPHSVSLLEDGPNITHKTTDTCNMDGVPYSNLFHFGLQKAGGGFGHSPATIAASAGGLHHLTQLFERRQLFTSTETTRTPPRNLFPFSKTPYLENDHASATQSGKHAMTASAPSWLSSWNGWNTEETGHTQAAAPINVQTRFSKFDDLFDTVEAEEEGLQTMLSNTTKHDHFAGGKVNGVSRLFTKAFQAASGTRDRFQNHNAMLQTSEAKVSDFDRHQLNNHEVQSDVPTTSYQAEGFVPSINTRNFSSGSRSDLPEDDQIDLVTDKSFRKALREVNPELPRSSQWYAWRKVDDMMKDSGHAIDDREPIEEHHNDTTERSNKYAYNPAEAWQDLGDQETQAALSFLRVCDDGHHQVHYTPSFDNEQTLRARPAQSNPNYTKLHGGIDILRTLGDESSFTRTAETSASICRCACGDTCQCPADSCVCKEEWQPQHLNIDMGFKSTQQQAYAFDTPSHAFQNMAAASYRGNDHRLALEHEDSYSEIHLPKDEPKVAYGNIRKSVEPEVLPPMWFRESTPAYTNRSFSPSPVSHPGDVDMLIYDDVPLPTISNRPLPLPTSSPDPLSLPTEPMVSPLAGRISQSPSKYPCPPIPDQSIKPMKRGARRKSAVQGSKVEKGTKSRNVTQTLTKRKVTVNTKTESNKVADAVARIEASLQNKSQSPRRSQRVKAVKS